jgi:hypothetical protein
MMSAFSVGKYKAAIVLTNCSPTTPASPTLYGIENCLSKRKSIKCPFKTRVE